MAILWCGGEDIDFPNGGNAITVDTNSSKFRSAWARCAIYSNLGIARSTPFPGGAITSAWLRVTTYLNGGQTFFCFGLRNSSFASSSLGIALLAGTNDILIVKLDGGTQTTLVNTGVVWPQGVSRFDMQLVNYGSSGTLNLYLNGAVIGSYTGNISLTSVSDLTVSGSLVTA